MNDANCRIDITQVLQLFVMQEAAYIKIHAEIPDILMNYAQPSNTRVYSSWQMFLMDFLSQGNNDNELSEHDQTTFLYEALLSQ